MSEQASGYSVESHFAGRAATVRDTYDTLVARLREWGEIREEAKKTCIHLAASKSALGGVYPRKDYLNLEFKTAYPIDSPRILKSEQISKSRYHHTLRLYAPDIIDEEVMGWLRDAYQISV